MSVLPITIPNELPIADRADELLAVIADRQVVIVAGETGSGKSTQLPKLCLALGRGRDRLIGHTQPRRVAARTIAARIAEELGTTLGDVVGFTVRFTDRVGAHTRVKVMTDGILLADIQRDRLLSRYDTLIIDEAHERSLNTDLLLGYLKQLLPRRPDLKVIITSATIDTERFSEHFDGAPVMTVSGRTYPVEVRYRPFGTGRDGDEVDDRDQVQAIVDAVDELADEGRGDVLVFLSGEREIHDTADAIRRASPGDVEVLPLYARLSAAEQQRIFQPHHGRRVVLATNVAETSLTVPGVRFVVDAGTARISRYSQRLKVQRLPIEPISRASADQRAGRCGRLGPGVCIRLYAEDELFARPEFTEPEIQRTNLAAVILQMTAIGLGDVEAFPFLDPPDRRAVRDGVALLDELGALEGDGPPRLTRIGRRLARLPVDPRLGRMVIEAQRLGCLREVMVIAAALSIQDPRERPAEQRQAADQAHRRFQESGSDFLAFVALWDHLRQQQRERSGAQFRRMCRAEFLHYLRVREWQDLFSQLRRAAGETGIRAGDGGVPGVERGHADRVHQAVLAGLLSHIGMREDPAGDRRRSRQYRGARGARFVIAPGSAVGSIAPRWMMAAELVETDRIRARVAAPIQPEWAERIGAHLVKRSYGQPRWDPIRAAAVTSERVTLYGLPIVAGRTVALDRLDPPLARELFIRHALVLGEWEGRGTNPVLTANDATIAEVRRLGERSRRPTVDEEAVYAFYDARLGADVTSAGNFQRWWRRTVTSTPELLRITPEALLPGAAPSAADFPGEWVHGEERYPITYRFDPRDPADGATVHLPIVALDRLDDDAFGWHVPGFREERVAGLLHTLPKSVRRQLAPAAQTATEVWRRLATRQPVGSFPAALAGAVHEVSGARVDPTAFDESRLPAHLRLTFSVEDGRSAVLAAGRDLGQLRRALAGRVRAAVVALAPALEVHGLTDWPEGGVPEVIERDRDGQRVVAYPALFDDGSTVSLRVFTTRDVQRRAMHGGVRRLLLLTVPMSRGTLERTVGNAVRLALGRMDLTMEGFVDDLAVAAADELLAARPPVIDEAGFRQLQQAARGVLGTRAAELGRVAGRIVVVAADLGARLDRLIAPTVADAVADLRAQLGRLVRPSFVRRAGAARLVDVERYLRAMGQRLDKLGDDVARDRRRMDEVVALERRYREVLDGFDHEPVPLDVVELGWLLEEVRVAVFAQSLGATKGASVQRASRRLAELGH